MSVSAIIVAAGEGTRAGGAIPKQFQSLMGQPALIWSLSALLRGGADRVVVVAAHNWLESTRALTGEFGGVSVVAGGPTRTASVRAGLAALPPCTHVLIHDAARPGLRVDIVQALVAALEAGAPAVAPALPAADALRRASADGRLSDAVDRAGVLRIQTPQAFASGLIREAYAAIADDAVFDDDLAVAIAFGAEARFITGDARLTKITYPEDWQMVERLMEPAAMVPCVGHGVDAHRFAPGDHVTLCGVNIAHDRGLAGHSDADAGWHALVDAILGALGQGDIGAHFPPSDPQWKGADSERFLRHAVELAAKAEARIVHVDVTLICERPKIGPHREAMRARTAEVLGLDVSRVSVKATTTERMGFPGREEGLAAHATATVLRKP